MKHTSFQILIMAGAAIFVNALLLVILQGGLFSSWALDWYWRLNGPIQPLVASQGVANQVAVAEIDNKTLRKLRGDKPRLDRRTYAKLIDTLASLGARLVAFDVLFDDPGDPQEDKALADSVRNFGKVISNCRLTNDEAYTKLWITGRSFFHDLSCGEGFADFPLDFDNFVRRARPYAPKGDLPCRISFAMAIYLASLGKKPGDLEYFPGRLTIPRPYGLKSFQMDLDYRGRALIPFCTPDRIATFSVLDILENGIPPEKIKDRIVLVGGSAEEFRDSFHTPFAPKGDTPGVEIHAHLLETLLSGQFLQEVSGPRWWLGLLGLGGMAAIISGFMGAFWSAALFLAIAGLWQPVNIQLFRNGLFVNPFDVWMVLVASWVTANACSTIFLRREKNRLSQIFRQYLSPTLLDELMAHPESLALGGARREAVVLFADVRGFTHMCEDRDPEKIITFLNTYFSAVTKVIYDHGGVLDKYIGDGLMAFFGLPIARADAAQRAVRAAIAMNEALKRLRQENQGKIDFPIETIGLGIHGGEVVVGNVGSEIHQEYTLLGDTVNVASRLESLSTNGEIVISSWVKEKLSPENLSIVARGSIKVKGRKKEIETFEVHPLRAGQNSVDDDSKGTKV